MIKKEDMQHLTVVSWRTGHGSDAATYDEAKKRAIKLAGIGTGNRIVIYKCIACIDSGDSEVTELS